MTIHLVHHPEMGGGGDRLDLVHQSETVQRGRRRARHLVHHPEMGGRQTRLSPPV